MTDLAAIQDAFEDEALLEKWVSYGNSMAVPSELLDREIETVKALRSDFSSQLQLLDDERDVSLALGYFYIELKSHWIRLNTQIQYSLLLLGEEDNARTLRAALVTTLIEITERFLSTENLNTLNAFLSGQAAAEPEEASADTVEHESGYSTVLYMPSNKVIVEGARRINVIPL